MKKTGRIKIYSISVVMILTLIVPIVAMADTVLWDSGNFRAYAYAKTYAGPTIYTQSVQEYFSPPSALPLNAVAHATKYDSYYGVNVYGHAESRITSSSFFIGTAAYATNYGGNGNAIASFDGTFTSLDPVFNFTYNLSSGGFGSNSWMIITDLTTGTNLVNSSLQSGSNTVTLSPEYGHSIGVNFGLSQNLSMSYKSTSSGYANLSFDNIAMAPEPISSILFITGGSLLAGRRFLRRKA